MSVLDPERARAALGTRLGDRFLQYAARGSADEARELLIHIDEHVALVRARAGADALADRISVACKRLLMRAEATAAEERAAIVGAVRYFLDTYDIQRDDQPEGFADDAQVLARVGHSTP